MAIARFKLPIGAKCQVTIPKQCMGLLSLAVGDDLLLEVGDDYAVLQPMVSVPRSALPKELWKKFEARRGAKPTDIPLKTLLDEIGYRSPKGMKVAKRSLRLAGGSVRRGESARAAPAKRRATGEAQASASAMNAEV